MALTKKLVSTLMAVLNFRVAIGAATNDTTPTKLFTVLPDANTSTILECANMQGIDSCLKVEINFDAMRHAAEVIMAEEHGIIFERAEDSGSLSSDGEGRVFSFKGEDFSYAVLTYTEAPGYPDLNGRIHYTKDAASFMVDNCGKDCHVLIKLGESLMTFKEPEEMPKPPENRALTDDEFDPVVSKSTFFHGSSTLLMKRVFPTFKKFK